MLDFQVLTWVLSSTIKWQICSSDANCHVQDMLIWNRDGSLSPGGVSQGRDGIWGRALACRSKPVFSRGKHCIVSVSVSLPSAPLSFKELITVKISELYDALRSGSFPSLLTHSPALWYFPLFPMLLWSKCSLTLPVFFSFFIQMQAQHWY